MSGSGRIRADRIRATESLYGPRRSERPSDLRGDAIVCPFCPGNEDLTGPQLTGERDTNWETRVVANRYPAVIEPEGRHEVIVETRAHDARWTALDRAAIERILRVYHAREATGYADGYAYVAIFKNSGSPAGASLAHPHAQGIALRDIPRSIAARLDRLTPDCAVCAVAGTDGSRIVTRGAGTVAYVPDGSRTSFEIRLAPSEHVARFSECGESTLNAVADTVWEVMRRLAGVLGEEMPFNMIVQSAPRDARAQALMHWELEIVPRTENFGGFELGTGGFLVSRPPEEAARLLRVAEGVVRA